MSGNNPGRALNVVKMRNRAHGMTVNQVTITGAGLIACDRLEGVTGLLVWSALRTQDPRYQNPPKSTTTTLICSLIIGQFSGLAVHGRRERHLAGQDRRPTVDGDGRPCGAAAPGEGGRAATVVLLLPWAGRGRGRVWRRSSPVCAGVPARCLLSSAGAVGHVGRGSLVVLLQLGRPFDDEPTGGLGRVGILLSPYGERTRITRCHCCSPALRARVTVRWSTRSPGGCLGWLFAIWSGTPPWNPRCASRPRGGTSPTVLARGATPRNPPRRPDGGTRRQHRRSRGCAGPGGDPPEPPATPRWWYSPTTPPLTGPEGPVR